MAGSCFIRWNSLFHDHRTLVEHCTSFDSREYVPRPIKLRNERKGKVEKAEKMRGTGKEMREGRERTDNGLQMLFAIPVSASC